MRFVRDLPLWVKLLSLAGMTVAALLVMVGIAAEMQYDRMLGDRISQLQAVVRMSRGAAEALQAQVDAGKLKREEAIGRLRDELRKARFGNGDYVFVYDMSGNVLIQPVAPE